MPIETGIKTIRIPHASNKRWLTLWLVSGSELIMLIMEYHRHTFKKYMIMGIGFLYEREGWSND